MTNKQKKLTDSIRFINFCTEALSTMDTLLEFERQHISGVIDLHLPQSQTMLDLINKSNQNHFGSKQVFERYFNFDGFTGALDIFNKNVFERQSMLAPAIQIKKDFLFSNETIFMYCVTLFFHQVKTYPLQNSKKYQQKHLTEHEEKIKQFKFNLAKHWELDNPEAIEIILPPDILNAIKLIQTLNIKSSRGAARKISEISFYVFFEQHFKVNETNHKVVTKITHDLALIIDDDTNENKTRDTLVPIRDLVFKHNKTQA